MKELAVLALVLLPLGMTAIEIFAPNSSSELSAKRGADSKGHEGRGS